MNTVFYLIRHGETDWNMSGRWQGHADIPLNEIGRAQARRLAARLQSDGIRFDAIYTSDLQRAAETAQIIGAALDIAPRSLPALREIDVGAWSGLTRAEVIAADSDIFTRLEAGEDLPRGGAERFAHLVERVVTAVERLAATHRGQTLALVTHGGPVRALLMHAAHGKDAVLLNHMHIGNTSISLLAGGDSGWDIGAINDMAHLEGDQLAPDLMSAPPDDAEQV
jgi:broad specificity phosphatase PhoE